MRKYTYQTQADKVLDFLKPGIVGFQLVTQDSLNKSRIPVTDLEVNFKTSYLGVVFFMGRLTPKKDLST
jgi:hypothetical protein